MKKLFVPLSFLILITFWACSSKPELKLFSRINAEESGIFFRNIINDTSDLTIFDSDLIYAGAGTGIGDFNNDGLQDLVLIGNQVESKIYINQGEFKFSDISLSSNFTVDGWPTGVVIADVNGDGWLDIYVCVSGFRQEENKRNLLFINNKDLTFTESGKAFGVDDNGSSNSASFLDYDNDGDLDLFVVNYPDDIVSTFELPFYLDPKRIDTLNCNQLYENVNGVFKNATIKSNIGYVNADGFQVSVSDVNNDGYQDIYVNNDLLQPDFFYINNGDGTFSNDINELLNTMPLLSMGSTFSDVNNDGLLDLISTEMMPPNHDRRKNSMVHPDVQFFDYVLKDNFNSQQNSRNMLQIQNEDGSFSEIGELSGISRTEWSWAVLSCDFNMDGNQDLFISNGIKRDLFDQTYLSLAFDGDEPQKRKYSFNEDLELIKNIPIYLPQNYIFENINGFEYKPQMEEWGITEYVASQGASYADFDNDGYPDLIISNSDSLAFLYKNNGKTLGQNHYLKVNFKGDRKNTFGLGTKVKLYVKDKIYYQQLQNAQGWMSSSEPSLFFGLGQEAMIDSLEVIWLGGKMQKLYSLATDTTITLVESSANLNFVKKLNPLMSSYLFYENQLNGIFIHKESDFNDFKRDKMLHKKMSREGPGIAVGDINNDCLEDFYVGGASGYSGELYIQNLNGGYTQLMNQPWHSDLEFEDMGALFVDIDQNGYQDLVISSGSNEFQPNAEGMYDRIYYNNNGNFSQKTIIGNEESLSSTGVIKTADLNGDGAMDLFLGGRISPSKYPSAPKSYVYINEGGTLVDRSQKWLGENQKLGMVTDAKFHDINDDDKIDLIIVGEWMPITILENQNNTFSNETTKYGLDGSNGWWNSLSLGDFNTDGKLDIVAGNFGQNSIYTASQSEPVKLFYGAYGETDQKFPIICYYKSDVLAPYADRDLWLRSLPSYQNSFLTYKAYADKSIYEILSEEAIASSEIYEAYELSSCVFLSDKQGFVKKKLPIEAQVSPVYGMQILDYNNDKMLDIVITGNSYSTGYEDGPIAASRGILLQGVGNGNFKSIKNNISGLNINADAKSAGLIYNSKLNSLSLLVGVSNGSLKSFECNFPFNVTTENKTLGTGYLYNWTSPTCK